MSEKYNFDEVISRENTDCVKYDARKATFGTDSLIPLWVADMDFRTPDFIMRAIRERASHEILGYTFRNRSYFDSIKSWQAKRHNWDIQTEWISFSPGVVSGISMSILSFTSPGDKIIVQPPVYFPFFECIKGTNRIISENPLIYKDGHYAFDFENLERIVDSRTTMMILCNPHNPGGMVWSREDLERIGRICLQHHIVLVSDEIHSDLTYSGETHIPAASVSQEISQNSVVFMSPSKTFNIAGLSTSYAIIPSDKLRRCYNKTLETLHISLGNIFGNIALEAAYRNGEEWLNQLMEYVEGNCRVLESFFREQLPEIKVIRPQATFLVWLDCRALCMSDADLMSFFVYSAQVGLNDGPHFGTGGNGFLRINIGCPRSVLEEGLRRMSYALKCKKKEMIEE